MKFFKTSLRIWFAATSIAGFMGGWALLAHAGKPVPLIESQPTVVAPAPLPTLPPLPSINSNSSQIQPLPSLPQTQSFFRPRIRTRGS